MPQGGRTKRLWEAELRAGRRLVPRPAVGATLLLGPWFDPGSPHGPTPAARVFYEYVGTVGDRWRKGAQLETPPLWPVSLNRCRLPLSRLNPNGIDDAPARRETENLTNAFESSFMRSMAMVAEV
jgi:hypothetical protein